MGMKVPSMRERTHSGFHGCQQFSFNLSSYLEVPSLATSLFGPLCYKGNLWQENSADNHDRL